VQKWQTADLQSVELEKAKHVVLTIAGITLHFSAGSKEAADEIHGKLQASHALAAPAATPAATPAAAPAPASPPKRAVHFDEAATVEIPPRADSVDDDGDVGEGAHALALYDFAADGEDELSVAEGERLLVLEKDGDDWWKVRNARGAEGVVPASYVEVGSGPV
jgi:hypothetical protein